MRIFIEADSIAVWRMSGIGHATLEIAREFDTRIQSGENIEVTLIVPYNTKKIIETYNFKQLKVRSLPRGQRYINYVLTRTSVPVPMDLFYGRGTYIFPNYKTWYTPFSRSIVFVHDIVFKIYPETVNPKNLTYLQTNFERWMRRATVVANISKATFNEFKTNFPQYHQKAEVVPLGVNTNVYRPLLQKDRDRILKKYHLPASYFLYVGNLEPRKNIGTLLRAYQAYADSAKEAIPLVLVSGGGWKNEVLLKQMDDLVAAGYAIVRPNGYVGDEDLPGIYGAAKALVHVAIHEGFGLPPLQAIACGTAVIASNIPPIKEVLGANAQYVDPLNVTEISNAMLHPKNKPQKSELQLTWRNTVAKLLSLSR